jgi:hypothetical protein
MIIFSPKLEYAIHAVRGEARIVSDRSHSLLYHISTGPATTLTFP